MKVKIISHVTGHNDILGAFVLRVACDGIHGKNKHSRVRTDCNNRNTLFPFYVSNVL